MQKVNYPVPLDEDIFDAKWISGFGFQGSPVANQELIQQAIGLHNELINDGDTVDYVHILREYNVRADQLANTGCDKAEEINAYLIRRPSPGLLFCSQGYYSSDSDY